MTKEQKSVLEFHEKFGATINCKPCLPSPEDRELRVKLIMEELVELKDAANIVQVADALGDLLYVVLGSAVCYGIDLEPVFAEIHRSNMTKLWPGGKVFKNDYGKILKPPTYSPARLVEIIQKQSA